MGARLRLFSEDELPATETPMVSVPLSEILEPLLNAAQNNSAFLNDFASDEVQIPADLYDVLMAFTILRATA